MMESGNEHKRAPPSTGSVAWETGYPSLGLSFFPCNMGLMAMPPWGKVMGTLGAHSERGQLNVNCCSYYLLSLRAAPAVEQLGAGRRI